MGQDFVSAYKAGLTQLLSYGVEVPSVLGSKSKASNFGLGDRPWLELIAHQFEFDNSAPTLVYSKELPTHIPYVIGLLAWTLDGRNDVATLAYYRKAATDFSDDGLTMCGAFGARLKGRNEDEDQIAAISDRLTVDPSSRRTFASIVLPSDNTVETLEYPCAVGVQMFLRHGELHWLTVMRAQQALTVLPYDAFLFSTLHHFVASSLGAKVGRYTHFSGTFHIYENERDLAERTTLANLDSYHFPTIPPNKGREVAQELVWLEQTIRESATQGNLSDIDEASSALKWPFNQYAARFLQEFGRKKVANRST